MKKRNKKLKVSSTAYRVLLLCQLLNEKDYSTDELIEIFAKDPNITRVYAKEVLIKYINTLKLSDFEVNRISSSSFNRYTITKSPIKFEFTDNDLKTIITIESYVKYLYNNKLKKEYESFLTKLKRFLSDSQLEILENYKKNVNDYKFFDKNKYTKYEQLIKEYEEICINDFQLMLTYKNSSTEEIYKVTLEPKYVKYDNNNIYLCGYNVYANEKQMFLIDYVLEIKQLPQKAKHNIIHPSIVFKLKGRLAKGYRLYEDDKYIEEDPQEKTVTISSSYDDKSLLFRRLIRYGENCEILYPKNVRIEFLSYVKDILNNYST